jgi:coatomer protein complex subunit gamma
MATKGSKSKSRPEETSGVIQQDAAAPKLAATLLQEFQNLKDKFKNEDDGAEKELPYQHLEKSTVLLDCRVFHDAQVVTQNPRKCCLLITKLLFLLVKGESFTSAEVTEVFFGVTKLFQSDDVNLRRMMYLFIKEIAETCNADDVIIVTASLTKDMNTGEDLYRANSMRVLAKIIDATMLSAIERYLKQAIVDKNAFVASSALMSGLRLFSSCPEVVRRWVNEVQEAVGSSSDMVQYHALSLVFKIKQHDRLAVSKIVQQLSKGSLRSPLATCLLIRYTSSMLHEDIASNNTANARAAYQFLENCLRHKSDMVIYEAAKAICSLPSVDANDVTPAITVLQLFLASSKPALRCAAMRTLSEVAAQHPISVAKCNEDMEALVSDPNRSIATLAITTLLKTGSEGSVDRLMKQISSFMGEIGDEFKVVVVKAIRELCIKYPAKHRVMVGFLATFLREEGGADFKKSIVDSIVELMGAIPETKEASLLHLCEFIEDCEFPELIVQILHLIGTAGPATASPARYIRFIFNRVILENALVRAAAISTLGCFGTRAPELRSSVVALLQRSLADDDDEVRDRAAVLLETFQAAKEQDELRFLLDEPLPMSFASLERSVKALSAHGTDRAITFASLPVIEEASPAPAAAAARASKKKATVSSAESFEDPASAVYAVPEFSKLGRAFRSCPSVALTETEMEYVVSCVKHVFDDRIVLQFSVLNTIDDQSLRNVRVLVSVDDEESYEVEKVVPAAVVKYGEPSNCFVSLKRLGDPVPLSISCELHFRVVQVDPSTGQVEGDEDGYEEEYPLEPVELSTSDYMARSSLGDFKRSWEEMGTDGEVLEKFALQFKRLEDAVPAVVAMLGMQPVDGTASVPPDSGSGKRAHVLHLSGVFIGSVPVLSRAQVQIDADGGAGVVLKIAIRSENMDVSQTVATCIN